MYMISTGEYIDCIPVDDENFDDFFHVDSLATPVVSLLNIHGYRTEYSCEGHISPYSINLEYKVEKCGAISYPYITLDKGQILLLKKKLPKRIGYIEYYKLKYNEKLQCYLSTNVISLEEVLNSKTNNFKCAIYINNTKEDAEDPYGFYLKSVKLWSKLYKFLQKNLIDPTR